MHLFQRREQEAFDALVINWVNFREALNPETERSNEAASLLPLLLLFLPPPFLPTPPMRASRVWMTDRYKLN